MSALPMVDMVHFVSETGFLVDTLRDAVCNSEVNDNTGNYWVLIDYISKRLAELEQALSVLMMAQSVA